MTERDRLIDLKAARAAYSGLATGIACACLFAGFDPPIIFNANALLFVLVTAEIISAPRGRSCSTGVDGLMATITNEIRKLRLENERDDPAGACRKDRRHAPDD